MENATKALLMATGVLIGISILSLGVILYVTLSGYVSNTYDDISSSEVMKFNQNFLN